MHMKTSDPVGVQADKVWVTHVTGWGTASVLWLMAFAGALGIGVTRLFAYTF